MGKKDEKIISFRLEGDLLSKLEESAARAHVSVHECAKRALIRELESGSQLPKLAIQTESIKQELAELRKDFAVATEGILVSVGKSRELASKFVKENLKGS